MEADVRMNDFESETLQKGGTDTSVAANETELRLLDTDTSSDVPTNGIIFDTAVPLNDIETLEMPHSDSHLPRVYTEDKKWRINPFELTDPFANVVNIEMLMPNGEPKAAEDNEGVSRDALVEFWKDLYDKSTLGVSLTRLRFSDITTVKVAQVIVYGFNLTVRISSGFVVFTIHVVSLWRSYTIMMDTFMGFIPVCEVSTLRKAVFDMKGLETEELPNVLNKHEVKVIPNQDNIVVKMD